MTFSYTVEDLATDDGTEEHTFTLRDFSDVPAGVMRRNRRNPDGLMWEAFEWGLGADQMDAFDRLTMPQLLKMSAAWGKSEGEDQVDQDKPVGPPPTPKSKKAVAAKPESDTDE